MGIGLKEIIIILLVAMLIFGYKRLPEIGSSLGNAIKGFKKTMSDDDKNDKDDEANKK